MPWEFCYIQDIQCQINPLFWSLLHANEVLFVWEGNQSEKLQTTPAPAVANNHSFLRQLLWCESASFVVVAGYALGTAVTVSSRPQDCCSEQPSMVTAVLLGVV